MHDRVPSALNPLGIVSHAQWAHERDLKPKTLNALRREHPDLFPRAIRRGNKWYATRAEFDAFIEALRRPEGSRLQAVHGAARHGLGSVEAAT